MISPSCLEICRAVSQVPPAYKPPPTVALFHRQSIFSLQTTNLHTIQESFPAGSRKHKTLFLCLFELLIYHRLLQNRVRVMGRFAGLAFRAPGSIHLKYKLISNLTKVSTPIKPPNLQLHAPQKDKPYLPLQFCDFT